MSPVFRKYTRPMKKRGREMTYAMIKVVNFDDSPPRGGRKPKLATSKPKIVPMKLGYMTRSEAKNLTHADLAAELKSWKGDKPHLVSVVGVIHMKSEKERRGVGFTRAATLKNRARADKRARQRKASRARADH